jgi:hypothetical protein
VCTDDRTPEEEIMNDGTGVVRRPWRAGPPTARTAAAIIATGAVALLAAACSGGSPSTAGSGGSPSAGGSSTFPSAVGFSRCMRSHGVPRFPDAGSGGEIPKGDAQHFGASTSQLQAAQRACQDLLPNNGGSVQQTQQCFLAGDCPPAVVQRLLNVERQFAHCMRSHGVPHWPDPTIDSEGRPVFAISINKEGFDPHSPQIMAKGDECSHLMPGVPGAPLAVSP